MKHALLTVGLGLTGLWSGHLLAQSLDPTLPAPGAPHAQPGPVAPTPVPRTAAVWTPASTLQAVRGGAGAVAHPNGRIYVWGGYNTSRTSLSSAEMYNPATSGWTAIATMPLPLSGPASAVGLDGNIYSFGGRDGGTYYGNSYKYSPAANTWTTLAPMPVTRWEAKALTAADGRIFVFGGWNFFLPSSVGTEVQIYTPATNSWSSGTPLPVALFGQGAALDAAGLMHLYGGISTNQLPSQVHEVYNPVTNTWATAPSLPTPARAYVASAAGPDGNLYVLGGDNDISSGTYGTAYSQVDYYNPATATWTSGPALPTPRTEAAAVSTGGYLYLLGGVDSDAVYRLAVATGLATVSPARSRELQLYPNPTRELTHLSLPATGAVQVSVLNSVGQAVLTQHLAARSGLATTELPTAALAAGVYTVRVEDAAGVATRKLVVR